MKTAAVVMFVAMGALAGCQRATPLAKADPVVAPAPPPAGTYVAPLVAPVQVAGPMDVASLVERLRPTVVSITTTAAMKHSRVEMPEGMPPMPSDPFHGGRMPKATSLGTGFIVDPAGFVVTNAHVVQGADDVKVRLSDDRELVAKVVGKDTKLDLALLKLENPSNLSAAVLGDSDPLRAGDWVIAIGNPFGLGHTVTLGIVSAKDRTIGAGPYDAFIQTDASINPGNSGGALFNLRGEVVGIPTAIRPGAQGIGFAVPVNALKDVLPQLRDRGTVARGKLGVRIQHVTEDLAKSFGLDRPRGALVSNVEGGSAGARAGLVAGDVITQVDGADVLKSEDLPRMVARHRPGSSVKLSVLRAGKTLQVDATLDALAERDDDDEEAAPPANKVPATKGKLGVLLEDGAGGGARVRAMAPDSAAAGHLAPGDVILEINRQAVKTAEEAAKKMEALKSGDVLLMRVKRGTDQRFVALKIK
jgi:serine protease Do